MAHSFGRHLLSFPRSQKKEPESTIPLGATPLALGRLLCPRYFGTWAPFCGSCLKGKPKESPASLRGSLFLATPKRVCVKKEISNLPPRFFWVPLEQTTSEQWVPSKKQSRPNLRFEPPQMWLSRWFPLSKSCQAKAIAATSGAEADARP